MKTAKLVMLIISSVVLGFLILALIGYIAFSHEAASKLSQATEPVIETPITETPEFLTYTNPAERVIIKYLSDWTKNSQVEGVIVSFTSPKTDASNRLAVLSITTEDLSAQPMTLDEYTKLSLEGFKQMPSIKLLDSSESALDGKLAHKFIYAMKVGQYDIKTMGVYTIKDNTVYSLIYVAEKSKYDEFLSTAQEMITSFEII